MSRAAPSTTVQEATEQAQQATPNQELERLLNKPISVPVIDGRFCPDSLEGYQRLARAYIMSDLIPFTFKGTGNNKRNDNQLLACVTLVLAAGMGSLKLTPEQALAGMMVVNNRTALFGDALPALIRGSGKCLGIDERMTGDGDARTAVCKMTRLHRLPDGTVEREIIERRFSVADAKVAKLWGKRGYEGKDTPWTTHPDRMLQMRARSFAARDGFADVLMGMGVVEELQDIEPDTHQAAPDKAQSAQAAIDALKPQNGATTAPTPQTTPAAPGWHQTRPAANQPAEPPEAQDDAEGQASEPDEPAKRGFGPTASEEERYESDQADESSQVTQGTDAEQPQAPQPSVSRGSPKPPAKPKGNGHGEAVPPQSFFEQQEQQMKPKQTATPAPTRPWHRA